VALQKSEHPVITKLGISAAVPIKKPPLLPGEDYLVNAKGKIQWVFLRSLLPKCIRLKESIADILARKKRVLPLKPRHKPIEVFFLDVVPPRDRLVSAIQAKVTDVDDFPGTDFKCPAKRLPVLKQLFACPSYMTHIS
jgi:hypothetical protein